MFFSVGEAATSKWTHGEVAVIGSIQQCTKFSRFKCQKMRTLLASLAPRVMIYCTILHQSVILIFVKGQCSLVSNLLKPTNQISLIPVYPRNRHVPGAFLKMVDKPWIGVQTHIIVQYQLGSAASYTPRKSDAYTPNSSYDSCICIIQSNKACENLLLYYFQVFQHEISRIKIKGKDENSCTRKEGSWYVRPLWQGSVFNLESLSKCRLE